jgi:hypothetical protein
MTKDNNGWDEYKRLILSSLESLQREVACLKKDHQDLKENMAKVKVYLTFGVALGTSVLQLALFWLQQVVVK